MKMLLIILASLFSQILCAGPKGWIPLTDQERKTCDVHSTCFITQSKDKSKYQIFFAVKKKNKMFWLKKVTISNFKTKTSVSYSELDNFQGLFPGERYNLYAVDISGDGHLDLALEASNSLKLGHFFFYWIYNPKKKKFVLTEEQLPVLLSTSKGKAHSVVNDEVYRINKKFQLELVH